MRLVDRLRKYLVDNKITAYEFENKIGVGNGYLTKQAAGKGTVGSEVLEKIHRQYPEINILWLLTGEGEIVVDGAQRWQQLFIDEAHRSQTKYPTSYPTAYPNGDIKEFNSETESAVLKKLLAAIKEQNEMLKASNADKDKIIAMLEEQLREAKGKNK